MDKKTYSIGVLTITAAVLFVANLLPVSPAQAEYSIKDRDYQLITAKATRDGEVLYVIDNRTGQIAAFSWDNATRRIRPVSVQPVMDMFK